MTGVIQIQGQEILINVLIFIFIIIFLLVISIITRAKVKSSVKYLGTLKALGFHKKALAASYIIYPLIIITISFALAFAFSFPVAYAFVHLFQKFYSITFLASPFNLGIFLKILIIPLILAIG